MSEQEELNWNKEFEEEVSVSDPSSLVVFSRDWTVETIVRQIERGNIDLNPKFQRRHAWSDEKRSKLIESLLIGVPVPEIVLAEDRERKGAFLVIDGKQRLCAVAGFLDPKFSFWSEPRLRSLKTRSDLNSKAFADLGKGDQEGEDQRGLRNADIRCTIISNYKDVGVLYDIFYRLNAGSVPLSSQELRQVLNRGPFANFLIEATNASLPLHEVMRLSEPDARLRDAEILLRYISIVRFGKEYRGTLTTFLDDCMQRMNKGWNAGEKENAENILAEFNDGTRRLIETLPDGRVGRKFRKVWESRFNRALYEVQVYYFSRISEPQFKAHKSSFVKAFEGFSDAKTEFVESIETTTKSIERYFTRYNLFSELIAGVFKESIHIPVPRP